MTAIPPISVVHHGQGRFEASSPHWARMADKHYGAGEVLLIEPVHERSQKSHSHFFAALHEAWQNLPERLAEQYPTDTHLRKRALIETGYRDERSVVCSSKAEAARIARFVQEAADDYAVIIVREAAIILFTAKSQSKRAMGAAEFQKSKSDVLDWVSHLIHVTRADLERAAA